MWKGAIFYLSIDGAEGNQERFPVLAEELARLPLDVIVTISARAIQAVKQATTTIPIVFAGTSDPVRTGFAASLARPGGNLTGLSLMAPDLAGKRLELIKSVVPGASRIAMLWNASDQGMAIRVEQAQLAARSRRLPVVVGTLVRTRRLWFHSCSCSLGVGCRASARRQCWCVTIRPGRRASR